MRSNRQNLLSVSKISHALKERGITLKPWEINTIFERLHWQERVQTGWVTELKARDRGAAPKAYKGKNYIVWPVSILEDVNFLEAIETYIAEEEQHAKETGTPAPNFREKYRTQASIRTQDGHYVRSKAEAMIDNWLYRHGVVHGYEGRLPIKEDVYYDFYIPSHDLYIEFWGMEGNEAYESRRQEKQALYETNKLKLLSLEDKDIWHLDDVLSRILGRCKSLFR